MIYGEWTEEALDHLREHSYDDVAEVLGSVQSTEGEHVGAR